MTASLNDIKENIALNDYAAFKDLYLLMYAPLMRFANIYTHCNTVSEDVLGDVFLKLWNQRTALDEIRNLRVYLYTAVKNTALNYRNQQAKIIEDYNSEEEENPSHYPDPAEALIFAERSRQIQKAIHELPPRCKLIFQLAKEEGLRYKEISLILGISIKTIDNQLAIAIERIGNAIRKLEKS